jgi:nitroimidazol reductase NimA-like FMN-containing flavoprotein (pyridoxamine 5'-phosphate oxidase superfamily)
MATFSESEMRFLKHVRVGRLATRDGEEVHVIPICPVFDVGVFYMATHGNTRKIRNLLKNSQATLLLDQYSEDWMRNVGVMVTGSADVVRQGPEFEKGKALLETKFQQYASLFPIKQGESVVICFKPAKKVGWDYIAGELREPH